MMTLTFSVSLTALRSADWSGRSFKKSSTPNITAADAARKNKGTRIRSKCFPERFGLGGAGGMRESVEVLGGITATGLVKVSMCSGRCGRCLGVGFDGAGSAGMSDAGTGETGGCVTNSAG